MSKDLRSNCPIAASLDILGDRWSMLILRDMLLSGKSQFGELASTEGVATNILADRLATLVERGLIERVHDENDRRKFHYRLLRPGVELLPVIAELVVWGVRNTKVTAVAEYEDMLDHENRGDFVQNRQRQLLAEIDAA